MAEPDRKIYDDDKTQPATRPDLEALEGGGETTAPKSDRLKSAGDGPADAKDLSKAEKDSAKESSDGVLGKGYSAGEKSSRGIAKFNNLSKNQKRAGVGLGVGLLLTAGIIAIISLFFIPLKILHIVNNLEDRFYAAAENAVDKEVDRLFSNYVKKKIRLGGCGAVIDHNCNPFNAGDSLVTRLYRGWSNGRLEERMWKNGEGFQIRRSGGGYEIHYGKANLSAPLGDDFPNANNTDTLDDVMRRSGNWSPATRNEIRQAFRASIQGETRWKQTMYRIKVGGLLERKYGIKRCIVGCKYRDDFADWGDNKKRAHKMYLADRVLTPRAEVFSLMVQCMLTNACEDIIENRPGNYTADTTGCTGECTNGGESMSDTERERVRRQLLQVLASRYNSDPARLRGVYDSIYRNGYSRYLQGAILDRIIGVRSRDAANQDLSNRGEAGREAARLVAQRASNAIPILGQIILAAQVVEMVDMIPEMIPKLVYISNSTSMVQMFAMYRTHADEIKEGNVDAEIVGTFVNSLAPGVHNIEGEGEEQIGGTVGAEQTPLYQALIGNSETRTELTSPITALLNGRVFAQTEESPEPIPEYLCKDNRGNESQVPDGSLTCPEFNLRQGSNLDIVSYITSLIGPAWAVLATAADIINGIVNGVLNALLGAIADAIGAICNIPGISSICDAVGDRLGDLVDEIQSHAGRFVGPLIDFFSIVLGINANLVSGDMSGGRTFDLMAGGADVSGNEYSHHGLGGVALTEQQTAENLSYFEEKQYLEYEQKSLLGRLIDTESEYSPMVKLAMAVPTSQSSAVNMVTAVISNPMATLSGIFNKLLSLPSVGAQTPRAFEADPFGVVQYGYPLDDPALEMDSDDYWNTYCVSDAPDFLTQRWNQSAADNADVYTHIPQNRANDFGPASPMGTNRCLLIQAAAGSSGAVFTDEVLTAEEIADQAPPPPGGGGGGGDECDRDAVFPGIMDGETDSAYADRINPPPSGDGSNYGSGAAPVRFPGTCMGPGSDDRHDMSYMRNAGGGLYTDSTGINYDDKGRKR